LNAWADAWSRKDIRAYLGFYGPGFVPPNGYSRAAWEIEREARIVDKPGKIQVSLDDPQVSVEGDRATARFRQHYRAAGLNNSTNKTIVFVRHNGKWQIQSETAR
ncbi:MAG: hypothetical protein RIR00_1435, partial [Pseudomonadota bacterium]